MRVPRLRNIACWTLISAVPVSLWAADSGAAMLYAKGTTWINGSSVPKTSAVFPGDLVQTQSGSAASINASVWSSLATECGDRKIPEPMMLPIVTAVAA